jgi:hypothetical protein
MAKMTLQELIDEAHRDYQAGRTYPLDPDRLEELEFKPEIAARLEKALAEQPRGSPCGGSPAAAGFERIKSWHL